MRIAFGGIKRESIVDGPGLRLVIFVQGCPHHCPGCHNPQTHNPEGGYELGITDIVHEMKYNRLFDGLTLSGGEPFLQALECSIVAHYAHELKLNVWCYTGYTIEQILQSDNVEWMILLKEIDVLVDGPFVLEKRSLDCDWRGSTNQRLIDVPKTLEEGKVVLWMPPEGR